MPSPRRVTHSYSEVTGIPGVSHGRADGPVVVRAVVMPRRRDLLGPVFEGEGAAGYGDGSAGTGFGTAPPYRRSRLA